MNSTHDVISALLDNEPFDPEELLAALSDPAGRALLLDLVALRQIVQPSHAALPMGGAPGRRGLSWPLLAAAAGLIIALVGGYAIGTQQRFKPPVEAPPATRVVQATPFTPTGANQ
jgi:hypothetical protein